MGGLARSASGFGVEISTPRDGSDSRLRAGVFGGIPFRHRRGGMFFCPVGPLVRLEPFRLVAGEVAPSDADNSRRVNVERGNFLVRSGGFFLRRILVALQYSRD